MIIYPLFLTNPVKVSLSARRALYILLVSNYSIEFFKKSIFTQTVPRMDSLEQKVAKEVEKLVEQRQEQSKLPATPSSSGYFGCVTAACLFVKSV